MPTTTTTLDIVLKHVYDRPCLGARQLCANFPEPHSAIDECVRVNTSQEQHFLRWAAFHISQLDYNEMWKSEHVEKAPDFQTKCVLVAATASFYLHNWLLAQGFEYPPGE